MENFQLFGTDASEWLDLLQTLGISLAILLGFYFLAAFLQKHLRRRLVARMDDDLLANFLSMIF